MITEELERTAPKLYSQEHVDDPMVVAKFFTPWTHWTWYMIEYDPDKRLAFGFVDGDFPELGYFSIDELEDIDGPFGFRIERDLYFTPVPLSTIREKVEAR